MIVTSFKLVIVGRDDKHKRINGFYFDMIENRKMISRAVTRAFGPFSLRGWEVAIDNGYALHTACHGKEYEGLKVRK